MLPTYNRKKLNIKNFFITGGTGYLGSHIVRELVNRDNNVFCLKRQSSNLWRLDDIVSRINWVNLETTDFNVFFAKQPIEVILHCATDYGRKQVDPIKTIEANLLLPLKLLHAGASHGVSIFINTDTFLDKGINNYSLSKKQFVDWLMCYSNIITPINVVLEHFYGPGDDPSKFVTYIIRSLLTGVTSLPLTLGEQYRDFIYINDVTSAFIVLIENIDLLTRQYYRFEIGSGKKIKIRELVEIVRKKSGNKITKLDFGVLPYRKSEIMDLDVDITGLYAMGWRPKVSLDDGLNQTINYEKNGVLD